MSARLSADFWIAAYRARLEAANIPLYVAARGESQSGAILVKLATLDGAAKLFGRVTGPDGGRIWDVVAEGEERAVDEAAARQRRFDPDIWILEIEDRAGRTMLDESGLDD